MVGVTSDDVVNAVESPPESVSVDGGRMGSIRLSAVVWLLAEGKYVEGGGRVVLL
jgi:hypothetical protein